MISIHPTALVASPRLGEGTRIWAFVNILAGATVGRDCNVCDRCFVENDVVVGDRVTIKTGVSLWDGVRLEDDVFVGPFVEIQRGVTVGSPSLGAADHRARVCPVRRQVFGLAGGPDRWIRRPTGRRFPGCPSAGDGVRSHSPLRGSPGITPGSLLSHRHRRDRRCRDAPGGFCGPSAASRLLLGPVGSSRTVAGRRSRRQVQCAKSTLAGMVSNSAAAT